MKTCTKCGVEKPHEEFAKQKRVKSGLRSECKACVATYNATYNATHKEEIAAHRVANHEYHAARGAVYRADHREEIAARSAADREANPEKFAARAVEGRKAHPEKYAVRNAAHRADNPEYYAAWLVADRKANPAKYAAKKARRRAAKLQATPTWADQAKINKLYSAAKLWNMCTGFPHHVDHVVPLKSKRVCGLHCEFNLQVLTEAENKRKGNRHWPGMP